MQDSGEDGEQPRVAPRAPPGDDVGPPVRIGSHNLHMDENKASDVDIPLS